MWCVREYSDYPMTKEEPEFPEFDDPEFPEDYLLPELRGIDEIIAGDSAPGADDGGSEDQSPTTQHDLGQFLYAFTGSFDVQEELSRIDDMKLLSPADHKTIAAAVSEYIDGNYKSASSLLASIGPELRPPSIDLLLANCYAAQKRFTKAFRIYDLILASDPDNLDVLTDKCSTFCALNRFKEARDIAERLVELDPCFSPGWSYRGEACLRLKDMHAAKSSFERALALDPENSDALIGMGELFFAKEDFETALTFFKRCTSIAEVGDIPHAWYMRGQSSYMMDRLDDAIGCLEHARRLSPEDGDINKLLGEVYCARALDTYPSPNGSGMDPRQKKDFELAATYYQRALELLPERKDPVLLEDIACMTLACGRYSDSIQAASAALSLSPKKTKALLVRSAAYYASGDASSAVSDCDAALALEPDNPMAQRHKKSLTSSSPCRPLDICLWHVYNLFPKEIK